jgi:hypothetical protein
LSINLTTISIKSGEAVKRIVAQINNFALALKKLNPPFKKIMPIVVKRDVTNTAPIKYHKFDSRNFITGSHIFSLAVKIVKWEKKKWFEINENNMLFLSLVCFY